MQLADSEAGDVLYRGPGNRFARLRGAELSVVAFFGPGAEARAANPIAVDEAFIARMVAAGWTVVDLATDIPFSAASVAWAADAAEPETRPDPDPPAATDPE